MSSHMTRVDYHGLLDTGLYQGLEVLPFIALIWPASSTVDPNQYGRDSCAV